MTHIPFAAIAALKSSICLGIPASVAILLVNSAAAATMQTPTEENVLAALVDFVDVDPAQRPFSRGDIEDLLERNDDSLRNFIWETSRHQVQVNFDFLDWVTINKNTTHYNYSTYNDVEYAVLSDAVSAVSHFADLARYDKVVLFVYPVAYDCTDTTPVDSAIIANSDLDMLGGDHVDSQV